MVGDVDDDDPLVMYLVVRESLNMSPGKIGAQCAHGTQILLMRYYDTLIKFGADLEDCFSDVNFKNMRDWLKARIRKVVLKADDKEWEKLKVEFANRCAIVTDAGFTEVPSGSETCFVCWPMRRSERPKILKKLQVL